jgi:arsenite-transporting ATPase
VISRFINWFHEFGIPVGGVLVNMRIDSSVVSADSAEFVRNRLAMQDEHMQTIWDRFDGQVRAVAPLFETEVRGVDMLRRIGANVFA